MDRPIKVLIVDDHAIVRDGLRQLLATQNDVKVIGEAANGEEALLIARKIVPDVILLDISMPKLGGLESISLLRSVNPDSKVIILSMYSNESLAQETLKAGASGYILKGDNSDELIAAIRCAHRGGYHFSPQLQSVLVSSYIGESGHQCSMEMEKYQALSEREREYFRLMVNGHSNREISKLLDISPKTGQKHHTSITKKIGISNPMALLKFAIKAGIVDPAALQNQ